MFIFWKGEIRIFFFSSIETISDAESQEAERRRNYLGTLADRLLRSSISNRK